MVSALVGFEQVALKEDVLLKEINALNYTPSNTNGRPDLSQQFMIFIFTSWDADNTRMKSVVVRYSTGSGIKAEFLVSKVREIITALYVYGFIVNNVCGDGATENRTTFKYLVTLTVRDVFAPSCKTCAASA